MKTKKKIIKATELYKKMFFIKSLYICGFYLKSLFGFKKFKYLSLSTIMAMAIIKIAKDSYIRIAGSKSFFCNIISLDIAVIAITSG